MKENLKLEIQTICIFHLVAIISALIFLLIFYMKVKKDDKLKFFLIMQGSMILWMIFKIFKTIAPTIELRWYFIVLYYGCTCILETSFLEFSYFYYNKKNLSKKIRISIYSLSIIQFLAVLTNPFHYLFYSRYDFWGDSFGILFYFHMAIVYCFIIIGFNYCRKVFNDKLKKEKKTYKYLISSAILIPLILNLLYVTKIVHRFFKIIGIPVVFDITPIIFTWSMLIFVYATLNVNFLNVSPILRHDIIENLETPIGIINLKGEIIYKNFELIYKFGESIDTTIKEIIDIYGVNSIETKEFYSQKKHFLISGKLVNIKKEKNLIIALKDISKYYSIKKEMKLNQEILEKSNIKLNKTINYLKKISKLNARQYIARELHDIIGHSLVVTIKLLEVSNLYKKTDKKLAKEALDNAIKSLTEGIEEMNSISDKSNKLKIYTGETLKEHIEILNSKLDIAKVKIKCHFKGQYHIISEETFKILKRITTELITNSLKHSDATMIFISFKLTKNGFTLLIMDNGKGISTLKIGNGLKGIETRVKKINGKVEFSISENEGFMSRIVV